MFINTFLPIVFLIVLLLEFFFLGKYISIRQEMYSNSNHASFLLGVSLYFFISFIVFMPFYFAKLHTNYILVAFLLKDFVIIAYLVSRRSVFRGMKVDLIEMLLTTAFGVLLVVIWHFVSKDFDVENHYNLENKSYIWPYIKGALSTINFSKSLKIVEYTFWPIAGIVMYSAVHSFQKIFSKLNRITNSVLSFATSVMLLLLFSFNVSIEYLMAIFMLLYLMQMGYSLIIYSRRRYATFLGIATIAIWGLFNLLFWAMLGIVVATLVVYVILRKPRASFFATQSLVPFTFLSAFIITEYSLIGAWIVAITGILLYIMIFYFGRYHFLEQSKLINSANWIVPLLLIGGLLIWAIVEGVTKKQIDGSILIEGKALTVNFNSSNYTLAMNIMYYIVLATLVLYSAFAFFTNRTKVGFNLMMLFITMYYLFAFNPLLQIGLFTTYMRNWFVFVRFIGLAPILIAIITKTTNYMFTNLPELKIRRIRRRSGK